MKRGPIDSFMHIKIEITASDPVAFCQGVIHYAGGESGGEKRIPGSLATCIRKKRTMHNTHDIILRHELIFKINAGNKIISPPTIKKYIK